MNGVAQIAATSDEQKTTVVIAQVDDDTQVIESQFEESKATVIETQVHSEESPEGRMDEEPAEA